MQTAPIKAATYPLEQVSRCSRGRETSCCHRTGTQGDPQSAGGCCSPGQPHAMGCRLLGVHRQGKKERDAGEADPLDGSWRSRGLFCPAPLGTSQPFHRTLTAISSLLCTLQVPSPHPQRRLRQMPPSQRETGVFPTGPEPGNTAQQGGILPPLQQQCQCQARQASFSCRDLFSKHLYYYHWNSWGIK